MISAKQYTAAVTKVVLNGKPPNKEQGGCIEFDLTPDLMIIAGPGSGKTTVLVLRALKHVIVDQVLPEAIVITTFTKKAAAEIRSRLITWGIPLIEHFRTEALTSGNVKLARHLALCDVNAFVTGTLDSLCEQWTGRMRRPGEIPPVMIEAFAARQIFARQVFGKVYRDPKNKPILDAYLSKYTWEKNPPTTQGEAVETAKLVIDRLVQDLADVGQYKTAAGSDLKARKLMAAFLEELHNIMRKDGQYDFALLEYEFLRKLSDPELAQKIDVPKVLLIDEYQDTNPLQEAIYFSLARLFKASVTIVGDDDQSLYRFRGATVELFRDFRARFSKAAERPQPQPQFLFENYRSTKPIVELCNSFIGNDPGFKPARVSPPKPSIVASGGNKSKLVPVLGMFRDSPSEIARDLASLLDDVFRNGGFKIPGTQTVLKGEAGEGNFADTVLLAHSVAEFSRPFMGKPPKARLPWLLRQELSNRKIRLFNPRGKALKDIPEVRNLLGTISLCIDPDQSLLNNMAILGDTKRQIEAWRVDAQNFINTAPPPTRPHTLAKYVEAWQKGQPQAGGMNSWPNEWPILDLMYKLLAWEPQFQKLPEFQVYLEAMTRSVTQATSFSPYQGRVMHTGDHHKRSRESIIRDILSPIAENLVEVDEELLTHLPRDHVNVMTIHQAKGLEFPLVIVDVGADFGGDYPKARFKRFPDAASNVTEMEDDLASYSNVGALRMKRSSMERTFEDLIRLYYVAYSRAQTALLFVGNNKLLQYNTKVRNVATYWQQAGNWPWKSNTPVNAKQKKPPATVSNTGIVEI